MLEINFVLKNSFSAKLPFTIENEALSAFVITTSELSCLIITTFMRCLAEIIRTQLFSDPASLLPLAKVARCTSNSTQQLPGCQI